MKKLKLKIALVSCLVIGPVELFAQQVTVTSKDGKISATGELLSFDDDTYLLGTSIGELSIPRNVTVCEGDTCPKEVGLELAISMNEASTSELLQVLVNGFASKQDLFSSSLPDENGTLARIELRKDIDAADALDAEVESSVDFTYQPALTGFQELIDGAIDMTVSTTPVPAALADLAVSSGQIDLRDERRERVIALDALLPIVHPDNPIRSISLEELAKVAAGQIKNWSELGGEDAPIRMILPTEDSSLDGAFADLVLGPNRVRLRRVTERAESEIQATSAVLTDVNSITITSLSGKGTAKVLPIRQSCGPLAYADEFAIKAEEYPLSQRVYGYTAAENQTANQAKFLDFVSSPDAQALIAEIGYVNQSIVNLPISLQGTRMTSAILSAETTETLSLVKDLAVNLATAERLSTTFRFTSGSSQLDSKSQVDIERMVAYLNSDEARNRDIQVIGFTDNVGRFDLNERLALLRATSVSDALVASSDGDVLAGRIDVSTYGLLAPVSCNDTADGRKSNRRVEIWLR